MKLCQFLCLLVPCIYAKRFEKSSGKDQLREEILTAYLQARQEGFNRKEATQTVADRFNCSFIRVRSLIDRWKPKEAVPTRLPKRCRLSFEEEALLVGLLLGMANISKPMSIHDLLNMVNKRYQGRGKAFTETWARLGGLNGLLPTNPLNLCREVQ